MLPDKACAVVLSSTSQPRMLLFLHPLSGVQLVKGTIEQGETPNEAALRELAEESGIDVAMIKDDLGCWASGHLDQIWSFQLCQAQAALPEQWSHQTLDDHGHVFEFSGHHSISCPMRTVIRSSSERWPICAKRWQRREFGKARYVPSGRSSTKATVPDSMSFILVR